MSFITHLNIRNEEITASKLSKADKYTVSGVSACMVVIGSGGIGSDPPRGCFDVNTSDSTTAYFGSTSAGGVSVVSIKTPTKEWHITNDGQDSGNLTISSTGGDGFVNIPNLCSSSITAGAGAGVWTDGGNDCIYYNPTTPKVGIGIAAPLYPLHVVGESYTTTNITSGQCFIGVGLDLACAGTAGANLDCTKITIGSSARVAAGYGAIMNFIGGNDASTSKTIAQIIACVQCTAGDIPDCMQGSLLFKVACCGSCCKTMITVSSLGTSISDRLAVGAAVSATYPAVITSSDAGSGFLNMNITNSSHYNGLVMVNDIGCTWNFSQPGSTVSAVTHRMYLHDGSSYIQSWDGVNDRIGIINNAPEVSLDAAICLAGGANAVCNIMDIGSCNGVTSGFAPKIRFVGDDDAGNRTPFGSISTCILCATNGCERGTMFFNVMSTGGDSVGMCLNCDRFLYVARSIVAGADGGADAYIEAVNTTERGCVRLCSSGGLVSLANRYSADSCAAGSITFYGCDKASTDRNVGAIFACNQCMCSSQQNSVVGIRASAYGRVCDAITIHYDQMCFTGWCEGGSRSFRFSNSGGATLKVFAGRADDTQFKANVVVVAGPNNADNSYQCTLTSCKIGAYRFGATNGTCYGQVGGICMCTGAAFSGSCCRGVMYIGIANGTGIDQKIYFCESYTNLNGCMTVSHCLCACTCIASGTKNFEIQHPVDKNKILIHSTLEGPEYGVYQRGKAQLQNGIATIDLPNYWNKLADVNDATVQLTNMGEWTQLTVGNICQNTIFVCTTPEGKQDACFHWEIKSHRIDDHIINVIAKGDKPGATPDGHLIAERWKYKYEINEDDLASLTNKELDDFLEFQDTWEEDDPDDKEKQWKLRKPENKTKESKLRKIKAEMIMMKRRNGKIKRGKEVDTFA